MASVDKPPVLLSDWSMMRRASISEAELAALSLQVDRALAKAEKAIGIAVQRSNEAEERQLVIHQHNEQCAQLSSWRRPSGWESHRNGPSAYRGYTKLGPDGLRHPHGEGQSSHPDVTYRCAQFELGAVRGLVVERRADGSVMSGYLDDVDGVADINSNDVETGCTYVGHWTTVGDWMSLEVGAIEYPDGSIYRGTCGRVEERRRVWPDGFGLWKSDQYATTVQCGFERGDAHGVALIDVRGRSFGGRFDRGRLVEVTE